MPWKCFSTAWVARHEHRIEATLSRAQSTTSMSGSQNASSSSFGFATFAPVMISASRPVSRNVSKSL
jgi:hypothetical protein